MKHTFLRSIHEDETGCIVDLIAEVPRTFYLFPIETHIVASRIARYQRKAQRVCSVLFNDFQWINAVVQRFAHLPSLAVPHQAMDIHLLEGCLLHDFHAGGDHAGNPESDDIIPCYQCAGGIEVFKLFCIIRPAQRREWP